MPTAPPLDNFDTFATNSKKAAHKQNLKNPKSYEPTRHPTNPTTIRPPAIRVTEAPLPTKISLKEYLKSKGKFSLQPQGNNNVADKKRPKTKYDTDTIIYPTTTYRPQTFEPTSQVAQNFAAALQKGQRKLPNQKMSKGKLPTRFCENASIRTHAPYISKLFILCG